VVSFVWGATQYSYPIPKYPGGPNAALSEAIGLVMDEATAVAADVQTARVRMPWRPTRSGTTSTSPRKRSTSATPTRPTPTRASVLKGEYDPDGLFRANHRIG
jgi:hypothetical protein